ncbi:hypothetical protein SISNIDRAFT_465882 [Sistotremastrum niveocremeum HHB9708]|uniref:Uncharacterized protein n=1 Tax=Sistotremastrum niveocremeum HHB9708 TaxID=1314777 RepID=A0A164V0G1_9AGAM|nr:hypothetical protein SISNIDRAFT_465882 [Sistotremastrum niveocremeum HHB9708]
MEQDRQAAFLEDGEITDAPQESEINEPLVWAEWRDGLQVSSTNALYIPSPPPNHQLIQMRSDGRYGEADHGLSPQFFCAAFPHLSYLPKSTHPQYPSLRAIAGLLAPENVVSVVPSSSHTRLRLLSQTLRSDATLAITQLTSQLEGLLTANRRLILAQILRLAFALINVTRNLKLQLETPMTWPSLLRLWGTMQRHCQEIAGLVEYLQRVITPALSSVTIPDLQNELLGAFTRDPAVALQLHRHAVPVWFISAARQQNNSSSHTAIRDSLSVEPLIPLALSDDSSPLTPWQELGTFANDDPKAIIARVEYDRLFTPNPESYEIQDLQTSSRDRIATVMPQQSSLPKAPKSKTRGHPYKDGGETPSVGNPTLGIAFRKPDEVPDWSVALDRCRHLPEARVSARHTYPPTLLFSRLNETTRLRFLVNWLAVRKRWFAHVQHHNFSEATALTRQDWRHVLSHRPERGKFVRTGHPALEFFDQLLPKGAPPINELGDLVLHKWFGRVLDPLNPKESLVTQRLILWELDEWTFRHEILELDERLSVTVGRTEETIAQRRAVIMRMWAGYPLDTDNHFLYEPDLDRGINSFIWDYSVPALNSARLIMRSWPNAPESFTGALVLPVDMNSIPVVRRLQQAIPLFFCESYYRVFQRLPIVPSQIPIPFTGLPPDIACITAS